MLLISFVDISRLTTCRCLLKSHPDLILEPHEISDINKVVKLRKKIEVLDNLKRYTCQELIMWLSNRSSSACFPHLANHPLRHQIVHWNRPWCCRQHLASWGSCTHCGGILHLPGIRWWPYAGDETVGKKGKCGKQCVQELKKWEEVVMGKFFF